jgi:hypothetical protein
MQCIIIECPLKPKKAEPKINEWLAAHSNLKIKFIQETMIGPYLSRVSFYYEE